MYGATGGGARYICKGTAGGRARYICKGTEGGRARYTVYVWGQQEGVQGIQYMYGDSRSSCTVYSICMGATGGRALYLCMSNMSI